MVQHIPTYQEIVQLVQMVLLQEIPAVLGTDPSIHSSSTTTTQQGMVIGIHLATGGTI